MIASGSLAFTVAKLGYCSETGKYGLLGPFQTPGNRSDLGYTLIWVHIRSQISNDPGSDTDNKYYPSDAYHSYYMNKVKLYCLSESV